MICRRLGRSCRSVAAALFSMIIVWALSVIPTNAEVLRGVALIVGNSAYEHLTELPNASNDARAIENLLGSLGFQTTLAPDRDARRLARALQDFVRDAEGADVAIVYYAGHGIEAGGENFLVPVDADSTALDSASERLVPVSAFIERLQATVPLAIFMFDACRENPFPASATLRLDESSQPVPMAAAGLGETRGARAMRPNQDERTGNLGTVIAFAAAPGRAALDGAPGGNSPYTAAVLRHLAAMAGEEFGTVMRMVAEEVYLKTAGRQRPWMNESLRRLLYFGRAPDAAGGEEGEILAERRQLLVTIAALPDFERRQVEQAAEQGRVPMDALYGMLRTLGQHAPADPSELEAVLRSQTDRLKQMLAEREALGSTDAEIVRLAALADRAIADGALATAIRLHERAKARVLELERTVEDAEADIRARRIEFAQVYARSAEAYAIAFDHLSAAGDYARAYHQVERWDDALAWRFKSAETAALGDHGKYRGDNGALEHAVETARQALDLADRLHDRERRAQSWMSLGLVLQTLGERESGSARLEAGIDAYRAALDIYTREHDPLHWALAWNNIGQSLAAIGIRDSAPDRLEQAVDAFHAALGEFDPRRQPLEWAMVQNNLGSALLHLSGRKDSARRLEMAIDAYRSALQVYTREDAPFDWAMTQVNLATALYILSIGDDGPERLERSVDAFRAAMAVYTRERVPLRWALVQNNLGNALRALGERNDDPLALNRAIARFRAALEERSRERVPLDWAQSQGGLGAALFALGLRENGATARLHEAVGALEAALEVYSREREPFYWTLTQSTLGRALAALGEVEVDAEMLDRAVSAYRAALEEYTRERDPDEWAAVQGRLGDALIVLGEVSGRGSEIERGKAAIAATRTYYREIGDLRSVAYFSKRIAAADELLARMK